MLKSIRWYASLAAIAVIGIASAAVMAVRDAVVALRDWAYSGLENLHQTPAGEVSSQPTVQRVRAHAFVARLLKRERPHVTSGWRMCPST